MAVFIHKNAQESIFRRFFIEKFRKKLFKKKILEFFLGQIFQFFDKKSSESRFLGIFMYENGHIRPIYPLLPPYLAVSQYLSNY